MDVPETLLKKGRMKKTKRCNIVGGASTLGAQILRGFFTFGSRVTWGSKIRVGRHFSLKFEHAEHFLTKKGNPKGENQMDVEMNSPPFYRTRFLTFCWKLISGVSGGQLEPPNPLLWGWERLRDQEKLVWGENKIFFVPTGPIRCRAWIPSPIEWMLVPF